MAKRNKKQWQHLILCLLYFSIYLIVGASLALKQPIGNPPDESVRCIIPLYMVYHHTIPTGFEDELMIPAYGFSYASRPILPYMIQAGVMKLLTAYSISDIFLIYVGRFTNLLFGLIMAGIVLKLGEKWFSDRRLCWLFAYTVTFLPEALFMHTYINTESCCMLSTAMILYALQLSFEDHFSVKSSLLLALGIILSSMSYYNSYGFILSAILLFIAYFLKKEHGKLTLDYKPFFRKGILISVVVLLGAGWWFIRNGILREGDFLALHQLKELSQDAGLHFHGYKEMEGQSFLHMLTKSDYFLLSHMSFIGIFGPMTITGSAWMYRFYKVLFGCGILGELLFFTYEIGRRRSLLPSSAPAGRIVLRFFWHCNMILCIIIPVALSMYYSYFSDYEPQGRYWLPALIPFCYYCIAGFEKIFRATEAVAQKYIFKSANHAAARKCTSILTCLLCILILYFLYEMVYQYAFPEYMAG